MACSGVPFPVEARVPCPVETPSAPTPLVPPPLAKATPVRFRPKPAPLLPGAEPASRYELMSVDELKEEIAQRGLDTLFCFSREDLIQRVREAGERPWQQDAALLMQQGTPGPAPAPRPIVRTAYAAPGAFRAALSVR